MVCDSVCDSWDDVLRIPETCCEVWRAVSRVAVIKSWSLLEVETLGMLCCCCELCCCCSGIMASSNIEDAEVDVDAGVME